MAGIRTCDRESQVQRPNHYTTEQVYVLYCIPLLYKLTERNLYYIQIALLTSCSIKSMTLVT